MVEKKFIVFSFFMMLVHLIGACAPSNDCNPDFALNYSMTEDGKARKFSSLPIQLVVEDEALFEATQNAAIVWNVDVGIELFTIDQCEDCPKVRVINEKDADIFSTAQEAHGNGVIAIAASTVSSQDFSTYIRGYVRALPSFWEEKEEHQYRTMIHELGHILGLKHEHGNPNTVMSHAGSCAVIDAKYAEHLHKVYQ